jgi:hypothetical protein
MCRVRVNYISRRTLVMAHHTVLPPRPANIRVLFQVGSLKHDYKVMHQKALSQLSLDPY